MIQISTLKVSPTYAQLTRSSYGCRVIQGKTGVGGHGARWWRRWGERPNGPTGLIPLDSRICLQSKLYLLWTCYLRKKRATLKFEPLKHGPTLVFFPALPFLPLRFDCFFNPKIMLKSDSWVVSSSNRKKLFGVAETNVDSKELCFPPLFQVGLFYYFFIRQFNLLIGKAHVY